MDCFLNITQKGPKQKKLRMNWCKRYKYSNWDEVMLSDGSTFYLKAPAEMDSWWKINSMWCQGPIIFIRLIFFGGRGIFSKRKSRFVFFNKNLDTDLYIEILEFSLPEMNKIMKNSVIL